MSQLLQGLGLGGELAGSAVSEKGTRLLGSLKRGMFESSADVDDFNARLIEEATKQDVAKIRKQGEAFVSTQEALAAASGIESEGFAPVFDETVESNELDALAALIEGKAAAADLRAEARGKRREGRLTEAGAKLEAEGIKSGAVTQLFSSAGSFVGGSQ